MSKVEVLLDKAAGHLATVEDHYDELLKAEAVSDELLYEVWALVNCCNAALDWTANDISIKYKTKPKSPYYPIVPDRDSFAATLERMFNGLAVAEPHIAAVIEQHQPFQDGKAELLHIKQLARINKHRDFTVQRKRQHGVLAQRVVTEGPGYTSDVTISFRGGEIQPGVTSDARIGIGPGVSFMGRQPFDPASTRATIYVEWRFVDPDVAALPTLQGLVSLVDEAVTEIAHVAAL